ncbi:MAG: HD-GYP domain-containing protein [Bacillota bacterium]
MHIIEILFKNKPNKYNNLFQKELHALNYNRAETSSYLLFSLALIMLITAYETNDSEIMIKINLYFFIFTASAVILFLVLRYFLNSSDSRFSTVMIYIIPSAAVIWGTTLISYVPARVETVGIYSIVILAISSLLFLKWYVSLSLYLVSFSFILYNLSVSVRDDGFFLSRVVMLFFLIITAWIISRMLYYINMQHFVANTDLREQKNAFQTEVLRKSKQLNEYEKKMTKDIIFAITNLLDIYDVYTRNHLENVAVLSKLIAEKMKLSNQEIKDAYWAGMVHDIGKLLIPLEILNKKGKLTNTEFDYVKKHSVWGSEALKNSRSLKNISRYVLYHHERWDGRGYPDKLKGNQIPLISQIISVADAWDTMCSSRAYRDSLGEKKAVKELKANRGTQFSPEIVDVFLTMVENDTKLDKYREINKYYSDEDHKVNIKTS